MPAAAHAYSDDAEIKPTLRADVFAFPSLMEERTKLINDKISSAYGGAMPIPPTELRRLLDALRVQADQIQQPVAKYLLRAYNAAFAGEVSSLREYGDRALTAAADGRQFDREAHFTLGEAWCVVGNYREAASHFEQAGEIATAPIRLRGVQQLLLRSETIHFDSQAADALWQGIDAPALGLFSDALHTLIADHQAWIREWTLEYLSDEGCEIAITFHVAGSDNKISKLNYAVRDMLAHLPVEAEEAEDTLLVDFLRYHPVRRR